MLPVRRGRGSSRLDSDYSVSELRCEQPLFSFRSAESPGRSGRRKLEKYLRRKYGDDLFDSQQYVTKTRVGVRMPPPTDSTAGAEDDDWCSSPPEFWAPRARLLPAAPASVFATDGGDQEPPAFEWLDANNSSASAKAEGCARRARVMLECRKQLDNFLYLFFRARRPSWELIVHDLTMKNPNVDLYDEQELDRWTVYLRFRMRRDAAMKLPLTALLSRMGLEQDPHIICCVDGFYGDQVVGALRAFGVPKKVVSFNTTAQALGLRNGDSIFVVKTQMMHEAKDYMNARPEPQQEVRVSTKIRVMDELDRELENVDGALNWSTPGI